MSDPIHTCEYPRALENEEAFNMLVEKAMQGIYSILPCRCDPPCRDLTDDEKKILTDRVNARISDIRAGWRKTSYEKEAAERKPLTLEDICTYAAKYIAAKTGQPFTAPEVYNMSPNHSLSYYLELYEEAVFAIGCDFYGRSAIDYFDERFLTVKDDPALKVLSVRYQNAIHKLEQKIKGVQ
jgi:hypothetical protein